MIQTFQTKKFQIGVGEGGSRELWHFSKITVFFLKASLRYILQKVFFRCLPLLSKVWKPGDGLRGENSLVIYAKLITDIFILMTTLLGT